MDLISLIIIISIIVKIFKKNKPDEYEQVKKKAVELKNEVVGELRGNVNARRTNYEQQKMNFEKSVQKRTQKSRTDEMPKQNVQAKKKAVEENNAAKRQVHASRMEAEKTTILQRAKANAEEDKVDETLRSLEESHGHSAHVAPAIHHHPEDELPESMLGNIEDLMVKGYEGNLCFERDFVGEAMDMVSRFSLGGSAVNES